MRSKCLEERLMKQLTPPSAPLLAYAVNPYAVAIGSIIRRRKAVQNVPVRVNAGRFSGPGIGVYGKKAGVVPTFTRPTTPSQVIIRPSAPPSTAIAAQGIGNILNSIGPFNIGGATVSGGLLGGISGHAVHAPGIPGFTVNIPFGRPKR